MVAIKRKMAKASTKEQERVRKSDLRQDVVARSRTRMRRSRSWVYKSISLISTG